MGPSFVSHVATGVQAPRWGERDVVEVTVHRPVRYSLRALELLLEQEDLPEAAWHSAPVVMMNGRPHSAACRWLEYRQEMLGQSTTPYANALSLAKWLAFLHSRGSTIYTATEADYRAHEYEQRIVAGVSDGTWHIAKGAIKQFHEWLLRTAGTPLPFTLEPAVGYDGRRVWRIRDAGRRVRARSAAVPLDPEYAQRLFDGVATVTPLGRERIGRARDLAAIGLLSGTGIRLNAARLLTHYEAVEASQHPPLVAFRTPGAINKYKRGVVCLAFPNRLRHVTSYRLGDRQMFTAGVNYDPTRLPETKRFKDNSPLQILEADSSRVEYVDIDGVKHGASWEHMSAERRLRLVDPDGSSPLLFVTSDGMPLSTKSLGDAVRMAARNAHELDPRFPDRVHPHMLRHTFATHMAVLWTKGVARVGQTEREAANDAHPWAKPVDAVNMVQMQLGHSDNKTTDVYVQFTTHLMRFPVSQILSVGGQP